MLFILHLESVAMTGFRFPDLFRLWSIMVQGSKKQDKFNAAKAAIDSVRDEATGQFDVNEALSVSHESCHESNDE